MPKIYSNEEARKRILFANNLRFMLNNGTIGRNALAKKMGMSSNAIGKYALGHVYPDEERIQQIADALGCTVDDLYDDTYAPWKFGESED